MLFYLTGNLFQSPAQTLVNTVNTVGVMGKGIAKQFKARYPDMFADYKKYCDDKSLTTGKLWLYRTPNRWILNFPTKQHWRSKSRVEWIHAGLEKFAATYAEQGITSIAMPQLGCGNGGLDWETQVQPVVENVLGDLEIPIYIYIRKPNAAFVPEHKPRAEELAKDSLPRQEVPFARFFQDICKQKKDANATLWWLKESDQRSDDSALVPESPLCTLDLGTETEVRAPGEDLLRLWSRLTTHGVVRISVWAKRLKIDPEVLHGFLTGLQYIEDVAVYENAAPETPAHLGIRYSPPASEISRTRTAEPE